MSEQIVDLIEAVMPGPRGLIGPQGPQGLPGVNAVDNDEAVASYVTDPGSMTYRALHAQRHAVVFSDSICYGVGASSTGKRYTSLLCSMLRVSENNYAVSGSAFGQVPGSGGALRPRVIDQVERAEADNSWDHGLAGFVLVGVGVNDMGADWATYGASILTGAGEVMDRIADVFPGVPVYVMCVQGGAPQTTPWLFERMPAYQRLLHLIQERGVTAIPAWQILFDHPDEVTDGIHPDDAGHARLAATARQFVQTGVYDASRPFCYAVFDGDTTKTSGDLTLGSNFADSDNVARSAVYAWADATMNVHLASTVQVRTGWGNGAVNVCVVPKFARHGGDLNQWPQTIHLDVAGNAGLTLTLTWRLVDTGSDQVLQLAIPSYAVIEGLPESYTASINITYPACI